MSNLLDMFCRGDVIVDFGPERSAIYYEFLEVLTVSTSMCWRGGRKPTESMDDCEWHRFVWSFRTDRGQNVMTRMYTTASAKYDNPKAVVIPVEDMLAVMKDSIERSVSPLQESDLLSVLV